MKSALLIEIGVEELPPMAMQPLAESFAQHFTQKLDEVGLPHGAVRYFATPRRLAIQIDDTADTGAEQEVHKPGPTVAIAFDDNGNPSKAGLGFARSTGVPFEDLQTEEGPKGERLVYNGVVPGKSLRELVQPATEEAFAKLPIPKRMYWGNAQASFVRPVHWAVALHGSEVIPLEVFGHRADRYTYGHRVHCPDPVKLDHADDYVTRLENPGHVVVDIERRRQQIVAAVKSSAKSLSGQALIDETLVDEVVALVEWPVGIAGRFDERYLELPREVLVSTLQGHQRYFPVEGKSGKLVAGFVTIANLESRDPQQVIAGNERVIHPRLADALFFWEKDLNHGLAAYVPELSRVSFQNKLGTLADKSQRIAKIASHIAPLVGTDPEDAKRASELAKTDLLTEMVGEFPELQGIMGSYYARAEGENEAVSKALFEQYAPASANAAIATSPTGRCIALADRLDTLAGLFSIDKRPSGDRDPFGLRRAALGILRTLIESEIHADLKQLITVAIECQPVTAPEGTLSALWMFHMERLRNYYHDRGVSHAHFEAIASLDIVDIKDFDNRLAAVGDFVHMPEATSICGAHKRIRNILKRNSDAKIGNDLDPAKLVEAAEHNLHACLVEQSRVVEDKASAGKYSKALSSLAPFAQPLDTFFSEVMVMSEDPSLRHNRLALLSGIDVLFRQVADISCLSIE